MKKNSVRLALSIIVWAIVWWVVILAIPIAVYKNTGNLRISMIVAFALLFMNTHALLLREAIDRFEHEKRKEESHMNDANIRRTLTWIVKSIGGHREKEILKSNPTFVRSTSDWNSEHKVVRVISGIPEPDGARKAFEVDLVTGKITG